MFLTVHYSPERPEVDARIVPMLQMNTEPREGELCRQECSPLDELEVQERCTCTGV